eukprot:4321589-Pleurochrysis_carterae.AAC.1
MSSAPCLFNALPPTRTAASVDVFHDEWHRRDVWSANRKDGRASRFWVLNPHALAARRQHAPACEKAGAGHKAVSAHSRAPLAPPASSRHL